MHGELPSLDEFRPFGYGGMVFISIRGKAHKQVMYIRKEFGKIGEPVSTTLLPNLRHQWICEVVPEVPI